MFDGLKIKRLAREAAPGWAEEAIALFGYNAEDVIAQQRELHSYPERYSFEFCLSEIAKQRKAAQPAPPSLLDRLLRPMRMAMSASDAGTLEA